MRRTTRRSIADLLPPPPAEPDEGSLDAIHLATALLIREDVAVFLTYDDLLATAARAHGVPAESPT